MAEAKLTNRCHRPFLHASKQVDQVAVEVVVHLEGVDGRLAEKDASAAAEHIYEASVMQREQCVENVQDRSLVSYTTYRGFNVDHLAFHEVPTAP